MKIPDIVVDKRVFGFYNCEISERESNNQLATKADEM